MAEKRTTRARAAQLEAAANPPTESPASTPSKPAKKAPLKRKRASIPARDATPQLDTPGEDAGPTQITLPVRLIEGQPLPTLPEPQALDLASEAYQSIIESGVLTTALEKSRQAWVSGTYFKLFHTKFTGPRLLKQRTEEDKQAAARDHDLKRKLHMVGRANITLDPHTLPIEFWSTEPNPAKQKQTYSQPRVNQYPNHYSQHQTQQQSPLPAHHQKPPPPPPQARPQPKQSTESGQAPAPVIQALAQRASSDPQLKAVMTVVAAGQASQEQLDFFQKHIHELTEILRKKEETEAKAARDAKLRAQQQKATPAPPAPARPPQQTPSAPVQPYSPAPPTSQTPGPPSRPPPSSYSSYGAPSQTYYNNYGNSTYLPATPKPGFRPLYFSFADGNGDKFFFPPFSILEWLPGNQAVKVSFLITKSKPTEKERSPLATPGSTQPPSVTPNADPSAPLPVSTPSIPSHVKSPMDDPPSADEAKKVEIYQPVTALITAEGVTNDPINLVWFLPYAVYPPDKVTKYMEEVFDNSIPAEEGYLPLQLPKGNAEDVVMANTETFARVASTPATPATPIADPLVMEKKRGAGRPRKSIAI